MARFDQATSGRVDSHRVLIVLGGCIILLLLVVQVARVVIRREQCDDNLHQIGAAVGGIQDARTPFPGKFDGASEAVSDTRPSPPTSSALPAGAIQGTVRD